VTEYPGGWFGRKLGAPVNDEQTHRPTPVGAACLKCDKSIGPDDQGMLIASATEATAELKRLSSSCGSWSSLRVPRGRVSSSSCNGLEASFRKALVKAAVA